MKLRLARKVLYGWYQLYRNHRRGTERKARRRWLRAWRTWRDHHPGQAIIRPNGKPVCLVCVANRSWGGPAVRGGLG